MNKLLFMLLAVSLFNPQAYASESFFECSGLAEIEEYRVGINLDSNKAGFFDNDTMSYMIFSGTKILESNPPQRVLIFKGKDMGSTGDLVLEFNLTRKHAVLISVSKDQKRELIGSAKCYNTEAWDDLN